MLQAQNISVQVGNKTLLDNVSLAVEAGQVLSIIGPNGAGKSTLLKVLSNEMLPSQGRVYLNQRLLKQCSVKEQARLRAILPQQSHLNFPFKVEDVVQMGRSPFQGISTSQHDQSIVDQALELTQVEHLRARNFMQLSGGEKQRVQLARVLAQIWDKPQDDQTRYLLLDEPTSALDLSHQHHVLSIARELAKSWHIGVLTVLHDLNLAATYSDSIAVIKDGKLVQQSTPTDVLKPTLIKHTFNLDVDVTDHPHQDCPLIISRSPAPVRIAA